MKNILRTLALLTLLTACSREDSLSSISKNESVVKIENSNITVLKKNGQYYISDDMLISEEQLALLNNNKNTARGNNNSSVITSEFTKLWNNGEVPFVVSSDFINQNRIQTAISKIYEDTGIKLIPRTT